MTRSALEELLVTVSIDTPVTPAGTVDFRRAPARGAEKGARCVPPSGPRERFARGSL